MASSKDVHKNASSSMQNEKVQGIASSSVKTSEAKRTSSRYMQAKEVGSQGTAGSSKQVQEEVENKQSMTVLKVCHLRKKLPKKLKQKEEKILQLEQTLAENAIMLPSDRKRVATRNSLKSSLSKNPKPEVSKDLKTRVKELSRNQKGVVKALWEMNTNKK